MQWCLAPHQQPRDVSSTTFASKSPDERRGRQLIEIGVEVRERQGVHVADDLRLAVRFGLPPPEDTRDRPRFLAADDLVEKAEKAHIGLSGAYEINPLERADELKAHFAFAIGATKYDDGGVGCRLQAPCDCKASAGLVKGRREPYDLRLRCEDPRAHSSR